MNLVEELQALDVNDIGRWPLIFRVSLIVIIFMVVAVGGTYFFVVKDKKPVLERVEQQENTLRADFEDKQRKAANFGAYRAQLEEMERSFGTMLRQLPSRTEVPSLLVDISQTGLAAGLQEELFQPENEVPREQDAYAELPIKIRLRGTYHEFGEFVSGIAALPRIVTLHDVNLRPDLEGGTGDLVLDVTAKTYRYLDEDLEE